MVCQKCTTGLMVDDSHHDIKVIKCVACGERVYAGYPKRWGALVCTRCGIDLNAPNRLTLCPACHNVLGIRVRPLKGRTYGETTCRVWDNIHHQEEPQAGIPFRAVPFPTLTIGQKQQAFRYA